MKTVERQRSGGSNPSASAKRKQTMDINQFVKDFADEFLDTDPSEFTIDTVYQDLDEWSSMTAMAIVTMIDKKYGIELSMFEIRMVQTIGNLFSIVESKQS